MAEGFQATIQFNRGYVPTQVQAGNQTDSAFRSLNLWYRRDGRNQNWLGIANIVEDIDIFGPHPLALTGVFHFVANNPNVHITSGGAALTQLLHCITFVANGLMFTVSEVYADDLIQVDPTPTETFDASAVMIAPRMCAFENQRAVFPLGTVVAYRTGTIACVGFGPMYLGAQGGAGAVYQTQLTKRLKLGIHNIGGYEYFDAGLPQAPDVTAISVGGGSPSKNMTIGDNGLVMSRRRTSTNHDGNASKVVKIVPNPGGGAVQVTFPAIDTAGTDQGQDAWRLYVSAQGLSEQLNDDEAKNGPYYRIDDVTGPFPQVKTYEWNNTDILGSEPASYVHDPPPDASYMVFIGDLLLLLSCHGADRTNPLGSTRPGPAIRVSLNADPESFPGNFVEFVNPQDRIIGGLTAVGRAFALTDNNLQLLTPTAAKDKPIVSRPLWGMGFKNQNSACIVNDRIYAFCGGSGSVYRVASDRGGRPARSDPTTSDEAMDFSFSTPVQDIMATWVSSRVVVAHDPKNRAVVYLHNNDHKNRDGHWVCSALAFMLETETWSGEFEIDGPDGHFLVGGACDVDGQMYFVGWDGDPLRWKTFIWDAGTSAIAFYATSNYLDFETPGVEHNVRMVQVTGKTYGGRVTLFRNNELVKLTDFNQYGPCAFMDLPSSPNQTQISAWWKTNLQRAKTVAVRVQGIWPGGDNPAGSIDEVALEGVLRGIHHGAPDS